jgi:hypothetical protein
LRRNEPKPARSQREKVGLDAKRPRKMVRRSLETSLLARMGCVHFTNKGMELGTSRRTQKAAGNQSPRRLNRSVYFPGAKLTELAPSQSIGASHARHKLSGRSRHTPDRGRRSQIPQVISSHSASLALQEYGAGICASRQGNSISLWRSDCLAASQHRRPRTCRSLQAQLIRSFMPRLSGPPRSDHIDFQFDWILLFAPALDTRVNSLANKKLRPLSDANDENERYDAAQGRHHDRL